MANTLITAPTIEPVTLDEAKKHARVVVDDDNDYIENQLIPAARAKVESLTRHQLITATRDVSYPDFPRDGLRTFFLDCPPLLTVTHVKYYDTSGIERTLADTQYETDIVHVPGRITEKYGCTWPAVRTEVPNAITIQITCGFGPTAADVPDELRLAILILVAHWYESREPIITGTIVAQVPYGFENLLGNYMRPFAG